MDDSDIMVIKDLAAFLRVHPSTIYRMLKKHQLPAFRVGSDWRFIRGEIIEWMRKMNDANETIPQGR